MASSRSPTCCLKLAVTLVFIFSFSFLPLLSVNNGERLQEEKKKMVLGSKPPRCVNKCMNCRPCMAALVIPAHLMKGFKALSSTRGEEDDTYYLLLWKCRCGDQLYQP